MTLRAMRTLSDDDIDFVIDSTTVFNNHRGTTTNPDGSVTTRMHSSARPADLDRDYGNYNDLIAIKYENEYSHLEEDAEGYVDGEYVYGYTCEYQFDVTERMLHSWVYNGISPVHYFSRIKAGLPPFSDDEYEDTDDE